MDNKDIFNFNEGKTYEEIKKENNKLTEAEKQKIRKDLTKALVVLIITAIIMTVLLITRPITNKHRQIKKETSKKSVKPKEDTQYIKLESIFNLKTLNLTIDDINKLYTDVKTKDTLNPLYANELFKNNLASCENELNKSILKNIASFNNDYYPEKLNYINKDVMYHATLKDNKYLVTCTRDNIPENIELAITPEIKNVKDDIVSIKHSILYKKDDQFYSNRNLNKKVDINAETTIENIELPEIYEFLFVRENNNYIFKGVGRDG